MVHMFGLVLNIYIKDITADFNQPTASDRHLVLFSFLKNQPWTWALIYLSHRGPAQLGFWSDGMFCKFIFQKHFFIVHWSHITVGWGIMFSNDLDISDIYPGCPPLQPSILGKCSCFRASHLRRAVQCSVMYEERAKCWQCWLPGLARSH